MSHERAASPARPRDPDGRVRVLSVIARLNVGGPAIHVTLLNAGLDPARFECRLVSGSENPGEGSMLDYALVRGGDFYASIAQQSLPLIDLGA